MKTVLSSFAKPSLKKAALIFVGLVLARVAAEFGIGFIDGFIAVWTDGV